MKHYDVSWAGLSSVILAGLLACGCASSPEWELSWDEKFDDRLLHMGKNNWIVIGDAAYPWKQKANLETITAEKSLPSVLDFVVSRISDSDHAVATAWINAELERIPDRDAAGIADLHRKIREMLNDAKMTTKVATEQEILKQMEAESADYNILVIKTSTPQPYSSVYLHLDCRYWDEAREKRLREALRDFQ